MEHEMKSDTTLTWNWFRVNVPTIVAIGGAVLFVNSWMTKVESRLEDIDKYRVARSISTDQNFAAVNTKLEVLGNIPSRVAQTET